MAQMTADMLGLPLENVTVKLGDLRLLRRRSKADHGLPHRLVQGIAQNIR